MDAQLTHTDDQNALNHSGGAVEGEEAHVEKKSMFSRVKARAKRVKDSIANKAHGGQGHDQDNQDEEDDDHGHDEIVQDPQVLDAPTANSTGASAGPTPAQVTESKQSVPAPSAYDAPWDTSFDHDAKPRPKGTSDEKFKDTNVPKGTLGDKFGEDTDLVKHQQEHVSPTSHQAKISEPVTDAKNFAMGLDENSTSDISGSKPIQVENVCPETFQTKVSDSDSSVHTPSAKPNSLISLMIGMASGVYFFTLQFFFWCGSAASLSLSHLIRFFSSAKSFAMASDANSTRASSGPTPTQDIDFNQSSPGPSVYDSVAPSDTTIDHDPKSRLKGTQQEHVSPTSQQAKTSEPVTAHESVSPERHGVNLGNLKSPSDVPVGEHLKGDGSLNTHKPQPSEDISPGNYQAKVSGRDAGVSPILHSFDKMAIYDDPQHQTEPVTTVGHDQSSASPGKQTIPDSFDATTDKKHPQEINVEKTNIKQEGDSDKAGSGKDVIASKVDHDQNDDAVPSENVDDAYMSPLEPPKEMHSSATNAVASKFGYGGTDNAPPVQESEITEGDVGNVHSGSGDATVSGSDPQKPQSTYMGMLASKLGYGETDNAPVQNSEMSDGDGGNVQSESEMNKKDSTTVQSSSGVTSSAVLSKIPGIGVGTQQKTDEDADIRSTHESTAGAVTVGKIDKEKGMGEAEEKKGVHEAASDALHKRNTDENMDRGKMDVPMGKVTESEEVADRLGSSEEERTGKVYSETGSVSPSTGVVDRFKGAFTSWFGTGGETNPTMALNDQDKQPQGPTGEQDNMNREAERGGPS